MERPVYLSRATPFIANLLTGFALQRQTELVDFIKRRITGLSKNGSTSVKGYTSSLETLCITPQTIPTNDAGRHLVDAQWLMKGSCIRRITSEHAFDVEAQVIDLASLKPRILILLSILSDSKSDLSFWLKATL